MLPAAAAASHLFNCPLGSKIFACTFSQQTELLPYSSSRAHQGQVTISPLPSFPQFKNTEWNLSLKNMKGYKVYKEHMLNNRFTFPKIGAN